MEALIQDLVDLAALDAGRFAAPRAETDAGLVLRDAVESMRPLAEEAGVALDGAACEQGPPLRCDYDRVLQVFSNLIGNAVRHTPRGGRIAVSATRAEGVVRFEVQDTGSGIAPDDLPHVFDRFRRGTNAAGAGLGLGLYIAKGIVEAYGGSIGAQSRAGEGSVFFFTLPVVAEAGARSEHASAPEHATHRA
jgi:signal transduction histidine kinase